MYIPFDQMPDEARVWIYPSNRPFSESEIPLLKNLVEQFLTQWTAHNQALEALMTYLIIGLLFSL